MRRGVWLYHNLGITFYEIRSGTFQELSYAVFKAMGISKAETIVVDPVYGNVFIKDVEQIHLLSADLKTARPLLQQYRHRDARMLVSENRLIIGGRAGLLVLPILGPGNFGAPVIYENIRDRYYTMLEDLQVSGSHALLKTDKGAYEIQLGEQALRPGPPRLIAVIADSSRRLYGNDTILLPAGSVRMNLDLINPNGRGKPVFSYAWGDDKRWQTGSDISFGELKPHRWYRLYLQPHDDVWHGDVQSVVIRMEPWWWQTYAFIAGLFILGLCCCTLIVIVTRKIVLKQQLQKQLMLELNLEATYARINPHFIFNSLSVAQYHIKADHPQAAARYINRFSRLLRSYLHRSRLRYINIGEEAAHLEDYIILQQERFQQAFSYTISIAADVDPQQEIPALLLQPFVENAIQHGLWHREAGGHLSVAFKALPGGLRIIVADNGVGRRKAGTLSGKDKTGSYGNELANRLVRLFNTYEKMKLHISYTDKEYPETGTIVTITIQYRK